MNLLCLYQQFSLFKWVILYCCCCFFFCWSVPEEWPDAPVWQSGQRLRGQSDWGVGHSGACPSARSLLTTSVRQGEDQTQVLPFNPSRKCFFFFLFSGKNDWCHCLFFAGIFDLLTAKASSLSVAGPSWSKSAGASEGTDAAVFPLEESV